MVNKIGKGKKEVISASIEKKPSDSKSNKKDFFEKLLKFHPNLRDELLIAYLPTTPLTFIKTAFIDSLIKAFFATIMAFFILSKNKKSLLWLAPVFVIIFYLLFNFNFLKLKSTISKKRKEIDKDVVFVGRYMLLKLYSGTPLLNVLIDQSKGSSMAAKYIKEIVDDVNSGSTLEESLEKAMKYTPSERFRKLLFHINNALKYGVDVAVPLESAINGIIEDNLVEIQSYGKKMNSMMIFYMLVAVVVPSLGITIFIVIAGFIGISMNKPILFTVNFFILLSQLFFIMIVKGSRPSIEL